MVKYKQIAKRLREIRKARGLSTEELGALVGRSGSTIEVYEAGSSQPNADMLVELCNALDCSIKDLVRDEVKKDSLVYTYIVVDRDKEELDGIWESLSAEGRKQLLVFARGCAATFK